MSDTADPKLTFIRASNAGTKILIVRGDPWVIDHELKAKILGHRRVILQGLHDDHLDTEQRGLAVCLRIDRDASDEAIEEAVSWAIISIAHVVAEHKGWDEHGDFAIYPKEITWRGGGAVPTRW